MSQIMHPFLLTPAFLHHCYFPTNILFDELVETNPLSEYFLGLVVHVFTFAASRNISSQEFDHAYGSRSSAVWAC